MNPLIEFFVKKWMKQIASISSFKDKYACQYTKLLIS
jgi:hypothetical protein